jgi:GH35 family endo-1,4-beta-xylanase
MRHSPKENEAISHTLINLINSTNKTGSKVDASGWESHRTILVSLSDRQLRTLAKKLAESMIEIPEHYSNILLYALSKSP